MGREGFLAALIVVAQFCIGVTVIVLSLYALRHYLFALTRLALDRPRDTDELVGTVLPTVTVLVPMHNEAAVAADILQALVDCDYDWNRLQILAIDDRSTDDTGRIVDEFSAKYPIIKAIHRTEGKGGKPGALKYATTQATGEILLLFDADYLPGLTTLKRLVTPFSDPEVAAVMGRVVPHNTSASLLAELLSLERAAGYQVGQQARYNLGLIPQFGGTVGGVRASALDAVGGWNENSLTEDTDLTCRLLLRGWTIAYVNRAECYEEVPENWPIRRKQLMRWVSGHTECLHRFWADLAASRQIDFGQKMDILFMLACYLTAPVMVVGWIASLVLFFTPAAHMAPVFSIAFLFTAYHLFGNQATFYELGAAALLDDNRERVLLIPFNLFNFFASTGAICSALLKFYTGRFFGSGPRRWHKTRRHRGEGGGDRNGSVFNNSPSFRQGLIRAPNGLYLFNGEV